MIAALPMYDLPALHGANTRFWAAIRARLGQGPAHLNRGTNVWDVWRDPDLMFAQTCGMPYRTRLHGHVNLVGTPDYGLPECPAGYYQSVLVVRGDDPRETETAFEGARFAFNEPLSQSGWAAPMVHLRDQGIAMGALLQSGAHAASARAVAEGRADLAGIDALTWRLLTEHDPVAQKLRVLSRTRPTPGLPYITSATRDASQVASAVEKAITDLSPQDRQSLHIRGLVRIPATDYLAVETPPAPDATMPK